MFLQCTVALRLVTVHTTVIPHWQICLIYSHVYILTSSIDITYASIVPGNKPLSSLWLIQNYRPLLQVILRMEPLP